MNHAEDVSVFLIVMALFGCLFYYGIKMKIDMEIPKYYDLECVVIREGKYRPVEGFQVPESYIVVRNTEDSLVTTLNTVNFPSFVDFKHKIGDTIKFDFIRKSRFWKE